MILDYVNERFEFYKKMEDNPTVKSMIFEKIYSDYQKSQKKIKNLKGHEQNS